MARQKTTGLLVNGSVKTAGVTFYTKNGKTIVRSSFSMQPERRSKAQFDVRMRIKHTAALWQVVMLLDNPRFHGGATTYARFASLAFRLPVVYLPSRGPSSTGALLLPDMPMSDGTLPQVKQWLGETNGQNALLTNLRPSDLNRDDQLLLYTIRQHVLGTCPVLSIDERMVGLDEFAMVDGCLALVDEMFADNMCGWALVRVNGDRCSSQTAVTRCTYYQQFTTEEALQEALESYGGLKEKR